MANRSNITHNIRAPNNMTAAAASSTRPAAPLELSVAYNRVEGSQPSGEQALIGGELSYVLPGRPLG